MNPSLIILILRARAKIVLLTLLVTVLTATSVSLLLPKEYQATSQLVLNYKGVDAVTGSPVLAQQLPGYVQTQVDILRNRSTALQVVDELRLADHTAYREAFTDATDGRGNLREWIASRLLGRLTIEPARDSSVLAVTFSEQDPQLAATVANGFARAYRERSTRLKVEPAQQASKYFGEQAQTLRHNLEQAQSRLSAYQQEKGITSADQKLDVETARLSELSQQMVVAQSVAIEARSRQRNALSNAADSPDVAQSPVIQSLKVDAGKAASKLAELSERLGTSHPQYEAAQAELGKIQGQLRKEIQSASNSIGSQAQIQEQREAELRSQVAMQKSRVLELNRMRDELAVLQNDVNTAQKTLDAATQRYAETSMEGQSNQSDMAILSEAQPPAMPATPRVALNILLSVVLGSVLGIGLGLIAELLDRRLRSSDDLAQLLQVPVVALIHEPPGVSGWKRLPGAPGRFLPSS